jgi:bifunctional ADP-heptose synthase (sugar kinase/adenylyltransferase)
VSVLLDKVVLRGEALQSPVAQLPRPISLTNGVFDMLHVGVKSAVLADLAAAVDQLFDASPAGA